MKEIMREKTLTISIFFSLLTCYANANDHSPGLEVSVDEAMAGSLQEITFTYTVGDERITKGGGIRIEYPVAYAETEFLYWSRPQTHESGLLGYVSGETSTGEDVIISSYGIAGGIFQCMLKGGELKKGDYP